jgi:hypothetical protein
VSIRVMTWVWDNSPVRGGDLLLLLAIADHADDYGGNAWPSLHRLAERTRSDRRTVQRQLRRLQEAGHLRIDAVTGPGGTNRYVIPMDAPPPVHTPDPAHPQPVDNLGEGAANCRRGKTPPAAPVPPGGRHFAAEGAALVPPEPSLTTQEPSNPARELRTAVAGVLDAVATAWGLPPGTVAQLAAAAQDAIVSGIRPELLIDHLVSNPVGASSPIAVLRSRLQGLRASQPTTGKPPRPTWCGDCDPTTRHRETDDGRPFRCPRCHPLTAPAHHKGKPS